MKKVSVLSILVLLISLLASACSSGAETTREEQQRPTESAEQEQMEDEGEMAEDEQMGEHGEMAKGEDMMERCPVAVEGTEVMAEPTDQGAAMRFTTTGDVEELRERVEWMAQHHNEMMGGAEAGEMPQGVHDNMQRGEHGQMHGQMGEEEKMDEDHMGATGGMMDMPKTEATYEETEDGARIVFTAEDSEDAAQIQQHIAQHVERVQAGTCPMMYMKGDDEDDQG